MNRRTGFRWAALSRVVAVSGVVVALSCVPRTGAVPSSAGIVDGILRRTGVPGGVVLCIGGKTARDLGTTFAEAGPFTVQILTPDASTANEWRNRIAGRGLYGVVSVEPLHGESLPYVDNLVNLILIEAGQPHSLLREAFRVVAPLGWCAVASGPQAERRAAAGAALKAAGFTSMVDVGVGGVSWTMGRKPWPEDIDEWTHYVHGADGNPVARDTRVGPPRRYQWVSDPLWLRSHETDSSIRTLVTAAGRLVFIENEAPIGLAGNNDLPDDWVVKCRDAFNGVELWKVPLRQWGWREWKSSWFSPRPGDIPLNIEKRLVAVGNDVYVTLGYKAPVSRLDARTGALLRTYPETDPTGEILFCRGRLVVSRFDPSGKLRVMAVDPESGKTAWVSNGSYEGTTVDYYRWTAMYGRIRPVPVDATLNLAADGATVALLDGDAVVGLDFQTGRQKWRTKFPIAPEDKHAGNIRAGDRLWVGALIVKDGVVVAATPFRLAAFDAASGRILWQKPKRFIGHLWYEWKEVYIIDGVVWTWTDQLKRFEYKRGRRRAGTWYPPAINGYDLRTGRLVRSVPTGPIYKTYHHHRCYRGKATIRYVLSSRRGTECVDLNGGVHTVDNWVRGTCHVGEMPANGLLYVPPHPCACYLKEKINGFHALAAGPVVPPPVPAAPVLVKGPAWGTIQGPEAAAEDWPQFRHDAQRSGAVPTRLPRPLVRRWRVRVGVTPTAPAIVGDSIFLACRDEYTVVCLDARNGRVLWRYRVGGRVDSPPTWHRGAVYFGANDGWVYCLRASDGRLVWKFRAAPSDRRMAAFDRIESKWPVHGSVLLYDDLVYCAAGRSSELDGGIYLYALKPATGEVVHARNVHGPFYNSGNIESNYQLPMGALNDVLLFDGKHISMQLTCFTPDLKPAPGSPAESIPGGLLDDTYFKRIPWKIGRDYGRLFVKDRSTVYFVRMFDTLRGLDPSVYFVPGRKGYLVFAKNLTEGKRPWMERVPVRIRAMVLTTDALVAAGPPDVVDPEDPLGAFRGRKGGIVVVLDRKSGKKILEFREPSPPVFNGIAAARGRLVVSERDGSIACFGAAGAARK